MSQDESEPTPTPPPSPVSPAPLGQEARDLATPIEPSSPADGRQSNGERVKVQAKRVLDEVEATPVIGDAYDWLRAIALGIKDTARDMLDEGRKGAHEAEGEAWRRFDDKTKFRRRGRK